MSSMWYIIVVVTCVVSRANRTTGECASNEFRCNDGEECVNMKYFCDGDFDCSDRSDEPYRNYTFDVDENITYCRRKSYYSYNRASFNYICLLPTQLLPKRSELCMKPDNCPMGSFSCQNGYQCISMRYFCDGSAQCSDRSDEPYRNYTFDLNGNITFCRRKSYYLYSDALNHICRLPTQLLPKRSELCMKPDNCPMGSFSCQNGYQCISMRYFCDGSAQCSDRSDEPYRNYTFDLNGNITYCRRQRYHSYYRASFNYICRLPTQLLRNTSELCSKPDDCPMGSFSCQNGYQCISMRYFCDGLAECSDRSDEPHRNYTFDLDGNMTYCRRQRYHSYYRASFNYICRLPTQLLRNRSELCSKPDSCPMNSFPCQNGFQCIPASCFCDGLMQCSDGSDELGYENAKSATTCSPYGHNCTLPIQLEARKEELCREGECTLDKFRCNGNCISVKYFCNGYSDCSDQSDEPYRNYTLDLDENITYCRRQSYSNLYEAYHICRLPTHLLPRRSELCLKPDNCPIGSFPCQNGYQCISTMYFCDGLAQCSDFSDEPYRNINFPDRENVTYCSCTAAFSRPIIPGGSFICEMPTNTYLIRRSCTCPEVGYTEDEFPCSNAYQKIPLERFCDGKKDCRDNSDEWPSVLNDDTKTRVTCFLDDRNCSVPKELFRVTRCRSEATTCSKDQFSCGTRCLPMTEFCDAAKSCPSGDDEKRADFFTERKCEREGFDLFNGFTVCTIPEEYICDGTAHCDKGTDECLCSSSISKISLDEKCFRCLYATSHVIPLANVCDGTIQCPDASDECLCDAETRPSNCTALSYQSPNLTGQLEPCRGCVRVLPIVDYERCKNSKMSIRQKNICDGRSDCPDATDEIACDNRFYCTDQPLPHIPMQWRCNKIDNCENGRDEYNCSHFLCNDVGDVKYLDMNQVCNRIQDCRDGSDECQHGCVKSAFSDEVSMIKNKGILAFVFIFSSAAVFGCFSILFITAKEFHNNRRSTKEVSQHRLRMIAKINNSLIMSLAMSDLLVGIYAFSMCIKSFELEGQYCLEDPKWRASRACSFFGALLIIGSEQSVLTMLLITVQRLQCIMRETSMPKPKPIYAALIITWMISLMLGVIPTLPSVEDYFVDDVTFHDNPLFTTIKKDDIQYMTRWLSLMHNGTVPPSSTGATKWETLVNLVSELNPNYTAISKYGYYSSHTVCLPTFVPNPAADHAWRYSLFLLVINFVSFLIILISYAVMYRKATAKNIATSSKAGSEKTNTRMQVKMTLIVATDFLCWMPICIMGFMRIGGVYIPKDAYLPAGLIIIPINSTLNPFLYSRLSDIIWDQTSAARESVAKFFREIVRTCFHPVEDLVGPGDGGHEIDETTV